MSAVFRVGTFGALMVSHFFWRKFGFFECVGIYIDPMPFGLCDGHFLSSYKVLGNANADARCLADLYAYIEFFGVISLLRL